MFPAKRGKSKKHSKKYPGINYSYMYLAAQTVKIASMNGLGQLTKLENDLEAEIEREDAAPPKETLARLRRRGDDVLHSKIVLLVVVLLNVIDCLLVLGELIMDFQHIGKVVSSHDELSKEFLLKMARLYPNVVTDTNVQKIDQLFDKLIHSHINWKPGDLNASGVCNFTLSQHGQRVDRSVEVSTNGGQFHDDITHHEAGHTIEQDLAHGFHYASISILAFLVVETTLKILCTGRHFFQSKIQVFDAVVITVSFIIDLVFIKGLMEMAVKNFVIVLAFLLPWRVIRVVNSLIVAVIDKERFQMKLLYKQKKKVDKHYAESQDRNKQLEKEIEALHELCAEKGIDSWQIKKGPSHSSGGAMKALGRLARKTADSLTSTHHNGAKRSPSPQKKNGMVWSMSLEERVTPSSTSDLNRYSTSTPNLPIIHEVHLNIDDNVSKL